jgi:hypothetical protein
MAFIDKIYGTYEQYYEFKDWIKKEKPQYLKYFYMIPEEQESKDDEYMITNFPENVDRWLWFNCPLKFVLERLKEQYGENSIKKWDYYYEINCHKKLKRGKRK